MERKYIHYIIHGLDRYIIMHTFVDVDVWLSRRTLRNLILDTVYYIFDFVKIGPIRECMHRNFIQLAEG